MSIGWRWTATTSAPIRSAVIAGRRSRRVFGPTYAALLRLAPSKPIMIAEAGSSEYGGSKAAWLKQALSVELPNAFPRVKAFVWFNSRKDGDWPISTSASARSAFAAGIASPYFIGNDFRDLSERPDHPIPP